MFLSWLDFLTQLHRLVRNLPTRFATVTSQHGADRGESERRVAGKGEAEKLRTWSRSCKEVANYVEKLRSRLRGYGLSWGSCETNKKSKIVKLLKIPNGKILKWLKCWYFGILTII